MEKIRTSSHIFVYICSIDRDMRTLIRTLAEYTSSVRCVFEVIASNLTIQVHRGDYGVHAVQLYLSNQWEALTLKYSGIQNILINASMTQQNILNKKSRI